jgi:two-component system response regulator YesN
VKKKMSASILLVDDDMIFLEEFSEYFDNYRIINVSSGEQALELLKKPHDISLVIMDVMMPGLKGTDVLLKIKAMYPELAVIIMTGYSSKDIAIESLKGHADDYIEKPFKAKEIKKIIERLSENKNGYNDLDALDGKGKVEKVKHFIEINCFKKTSLSDASQAVCLSAKYLSRIFKKHSGMTFGEYKRKIKIEKAKELLLSSTRTVAQISCKLGYENTESFIRQFKKLTNNVPTAYRKKNKSQKTERRQKKNRKK